MKMGTPHFRMKKFAPLAKIMESDTMVPVKGFSKKEWDEVI